MHSSKNVNQTLADADKNYLTIRTIGIETP